MLDDRPVWGARRTVLRNTIVGIFSFPFELVVPNCYHLSKNRAFLIGTEVFDFFCSETPCVSTRLSVGERFSQNRTTKAVFSLG